jgi:hypothetical protein
MNRRQIINKILHDHIDVNKHEDYTNYKKLITAIEEWHESEVKKCDLADVVKPKGTLCLYESGDTTSARCIHCGREKWEHKRA